MLDVSFFQIFPQFSNLGFSLLVELSLSPGLPFSFQLLFQFFYPRLNLLDGFLNLGDNLLLIIQFTIENSEILFFPLNCRLSLLLLPLQFRDRFLSYLEITFNPPPSFFNVSTGLLFTIQTALQLIQSSIKLGLDFGQMINLIFSSLEILKALGGILTQMLLLLVELIDDLILVGNFIIKSANGVIPVCLLLLKLLDGQFKIFNVLLDDFIVSFKSFLVCSSLLSALFHFDQFI